MTVREFVENLYDSCREGAEIMSVENAANDIKLFEENGWDMPEELTAESYAEIWNELVRRYNAH